MNKVISETYPCLQGEGSLAGTPSILIRTLGCNLRCQWCDTPYTSWELEKGTYSVADIRPILEKHPQINDVIITGGEPCICSEIKEIANVCFTMKKRITLETNATCLLPADLMGKIDLVSLSPKLSNSIPLNTKWESKHDNDRICIPVIKQWIDTAKSFQLKFVVSKPEDIDEVKAIVADLGIGNENVFLMPLGTTEQQLKAKRLWLADVCINNGFHYCERLHIVIYGDKRGV